MVEEVSQEFKNELKKQTNEQAVKWFIALSLVLFAVAATGWWFYIEPRVKQYIRDTVEVPDFEVIKAEALKNTVPVGTIVQSVLPPEKFIMPIDGVWVPADGRTIDEALKYAEYSGSAFVPDLRGVFIRGLNAFERDKLRVDEYIDPEIGRVAGSFQKEAIVSHSHGVPGALSGWAGGPFDMFGKNPKGSVEYPKKGTETVSVGGKETRPNNIAVYFYIRVD